MDHISEFAKRYRREFDYYDQVARLAAQRLETIIQSAGIRAIVSARAKSPARLETKAIQRNTRKPYNSVEDIYNDIVDLAGIRIALYFPGDRAEVDRLVKANFDLLDDPKVFPTEGTPSYSKRFSGYWATHYRIRLRERDLIDNQKRYSEARLELQVASVLMHAWSEVEHDLVYKPFAGELSKDEYAILDELNGLVLAGEIALERLQRAMELRVAQGDRKFSNHYDLAAFLFEVTRPILENAPTDAALGRIDILFGLLDRLNLATPNHLNNFIQFLHGDTEQRPIADQIIDQILADDQDRYRIYSEVRGSYEREGNVPSLDYLGETSKEAMGQFLQSWINFERLIRDRAADFNPSPHYPLMPSSSAVKAMGIADAGLLFDINRIRKFRNNFVHGIEIPDTDTLKSYSHRLDEITRELRGPKKPHKSGKASSKKQDDSANGGSS